MFISRIANYTSARSARPRPVTLDLMGRPDGFCWKSQKSGGFDRRFRLLVIGINSTEGEVMTAIISTGSSFGFDQANTTADDFSGCAKDSMHAQERGSYSFSILQTEWGGYELDFHGLEGRKSYELFLSGQLVGIAVTNRYGNLKLRINSEIAINTHILSLELPTVFCRRYQYRTGKVSWVWIAS